MIHGVPWGVLSDGSLREGLVTLSDRMDLDVSGERASRAYVALRMIYTRFGRARSERDLDIELSHEATVALSQELATIPDLQGLRATLLIQLREDEAADEASPPPPRPDRPTVRESRAFRFQR